MSTDTQKNRAVSIRNCFPISAARQANDYRFRFEKNWSVTIS